MADMLSRHPCDSVMRMIIKTDNGRVIIYGEGEGYQFFKLGSQKILTLPLNTNKKSATLPWP